MLNFIYNVFSTIQDQNFCFDFQMIAIEKSSPILFHPLSFVLYMYPDAILYGMLYLYTGPSIFDLIIFFFVCLFFFISCIHDLVLVLFCFLTRLFVSMSVSVTFPSQAKG